LREKRTGEQRGGRGASRQGAKVKKNTNKMGEIGQEFQLETKSKRCAVNRTRRGEKGSKKENLCATLCIKTKSLGCGGGRTKARKNRGEGELKEFKKIKKTYSLKQNWSNRKSPKGDLPTNYTTVNPQTPKKP